MSREPITRWLLLWRLYGLPRCTQSYPFDDAIDACHRLIWPWQAREVRNGSPVHLSCIAQQREGADSGHLYVHVAACPCPEMQAEVARLAAAQQPEGAGSRWTVGVDEFGEEHIDDTAQQREGAG